MCETNTPKNELTLTTYYYKTGRNTCNSYMIKKHLTLCTLDYTYIHFIITPFVEKMTNKVIHI